jgi:hypothetical protein
MSENDPRFDYPVEFVKQHVLGCFEASKACSILPGKPHLYHVEFLKRTDSTVIKDGSAWPLDHYLQAHFSPCEEVTWYLHTRKDFATYEGSEQADEQYVRDNEQGVIDPQVVDAATKLAEVFREMYLAPLVEAAIAANSVPTTPENSTESVTDTFNCQACANPGLFRSPGVLFEHSQACRDKRSGCYSCSNPSKNVGHSLGCKKRLNPQPDCRRCAETHSTILVHSRACIKRYIKLQKEKYAKP